MMKGITHDSLGSGDKEKLRITQGQNSTDSARTFCPFLELILIFENVTVNFFFLHKRI